MHHARPRTTGPTVTRTAPLGRAGESVRSRRQAAAVARERHYGHEGRLRPRSARRRTPRLSRAEDRMATIEIEGARAPLLADRTLLDFADELALDVPESCRRSGRCHECIVEVRAGAEALSAPSPAEDFLHDGYRLACQARVVRTDVDVEIAVLRRRLRILEAPAPPSAALDPAVEVVGGRVRYLGGGGEPIDDLGPATGRTLGIALDIGTTT